MNRLALPRDPRFLIRAPPRLFLADTEVCASLDAVLTSPAEGAQCCDHMVARCDVGNSLTNGQDHSGGLMPQHRRCEMRIRPIEEDEVTMANTGGGYLDENLGRPGIVDSHGLD